MTRDSDAFYDLVYDAWRSGRDSDAVSWDRYDSMLARGYAPEEISLSDVLPEQQPEQMDGGRDDQ